MSENLRAFTQAIYAFDAVVNRMPASGWDADSPCDGWNGRDVLQHQCAVLGGVAVIARTGQMARPIPPEEVSDPVATWRATRDEVLEALDQKGALGQAGPFWFDTETIDDLIAVVAWDPVTHTWDLAQCAGLDHALNPELVTKVMAHIEPMQPMLAKSGRTAEAVEVDANAGVVDRYLALVGRTPKPLSGQRPEAQA